MKTEKIKKKLKGFDEWAKDMDEMAKSAPSDDEILVQFERGDFSSLHPDSIKDNPSRIKDE